MHVCLRARRALRRPLDMPVLLLCGADDFALGTQLLNGVEAVLPHGAVKVLQNCSHWWVVAGVAEWRHVRRTGHVRVAWTSSVIAPLTARRVQQDYPQQVSEMVQEWLAQHQQ